jgi:hypothetical protein
LAWGELIAWGRHDVFVPALRLVRPHPRWPRRASSGRLRLCWLWPACDGRVDESGLRSSLPPGHRFPRDVILLAVRYYLQLGAAAERIAGVLADRGIDVSRGLRPMRGLKSFDCAKRLFRALDALQLIERGFVTVPCTGLPLAGGRSYVRARNVAGIVNRLGQGV